MDSSSSCKNINIDTGLCNQCNDNMTLKGYICVPKGNKAETNCYMVQNGTNITCMYCKMGYGAYFGECLPLKSIIEFIGFKKSDCNNVQYLKDNQLSCLASVGKLFDNCFILDFGFEKCLICQDGYLPNQKGQCISIISKLCKNISANGTCLVCK